MDIEQAIRLLNPETTVEAIAEIEYYNGFSGKKAAIHAIDDACKIACEAMRKQIPKEPWFDVENWCCPVCGVALDENTKDNHCYYCGQKLNWGE